MLLVFSYRVGPAHCIASQLLFIEVHVRRHVSNVMYACLEVWTPSSRTLLSTMAESGKMCALATVALTLAILAVV